MSSSCRPGRRRMLETTSDRERSEADFAPAIVLRRGGETLRLEPWGRNSVRIRVSFGSGDDGALGALLAMPAATTGAVDRSGRRLVVDDLAVDVDELGRLRFSRASVDEELLAEKPIRSL